MSLECYTSTEAMSCSYDVKISTLIFSFLTGESPYYLKNLSSGQYELLVIGKRKAFIGSLRFKFTIERDNLCDPVIHLSAVPATNSSVVVSFRGECFTVPGSEETVQFQCSTAGREFAPCKLMHNIDSNVLYTLGLQLFAGTNFNEFHNLLIWWVLILADCGRKF